MLSSVLHSERAVQVNIEVVRTFVRLRQIPSSHEDLAHQLASLEAKHDQQFRVVFVTPLRKGLFTTRRAICPL